MRLIISFSDHVETEDADKKKGRTNLVSFDKRYKRYGEVIDKLLSLKYRFMTLYGAEHERLFDKLWEIIVKIQFAEMERIDILEGNIDIPDRSERVNKLRELNQILYYTSQNDPIEQLLNNLIQSVEDVCQTIIFGEGAFKRKTEKRKQLS